MDELLEYLQSDGDSDPFVRLRSLAVQDNALVLDIASSFVFGDSQWINWSITATDVLSYVINGPHGDLMIHDGSHTLAREQSDPVVGVYFSAAPRDADRTVAQLVAAHSKATWDHIPVVKYLQLGSLPEHLAEGYGKLAEGPQFLMAAYSRVLEANAMRPSSVPPRPARVWSSGDQTWKPLAFDAKVLTLGDSHVVARDFQARRHGGADLA